MTDANQPEGTAQPSKNQRKQEMAERRQLAEKLVKLPQAQLDRLPYPALQEATKEARRMAKPAARKRQIQYLAKLLGQVDPAPVKALIETKEAGSQAWTQQFHQLESWRSRLLAGDLSALEEICEACPAADRQRLRQLSRLASKEQQEGKSQRQFRKLFQYLRELVEA